MASPDTHVRSHIAALDGLRGLAILLVLLFHTAGGAQSPNPVLHAVGRINQSGWIGVPLFFVLSGFLITGILWRNFEDPHWARCFYMRRILRIFPLYYLALLLVILVAALQGNWLPIMQRIWIPTLFLQNLPHLYSLCITTPSPLKLYHLWTIAVEEQFYLLWPFLLSLQRTPRQALKLCAAVIATSILFQIALAFTPWLDLFAPSLISCVAQLAFGAALAILIQTPHWQALTRNAPIVFFSGLAIFAVSTVCDQRSNPSAILHQLVEIPSITLAFAALLVLALQPSRLQNLLSLRWLRWIGEISFGMYIYHVLLLPLFNSTARHLTHNSTGIVYLTARFLIALFGTILISWISFRFYERPFLRLKRYFPSRAAVEAKNILAPSSHPSNSARSTVHTTVRQP